MHRYLHSYEDLLLMVDDSIVRVGSKLADGPRKHPRHKYPDDGDDDEFDEYDDGDDDYFDRDQDYDNDDDDRSDDR